MERRDAPNISEQDNPISLLKPGLLLRGEYELIQPLGRSVFGALWKAKDIVANRWVVLRFLPFELKYSETAIQELQDVFNLYDLHHQHIGALYILKNDPRLGFYVVMQYLSGESLDAYVQRHDPQQQGLSFRQVLEIVKPIAAALDYAHRRNAIHRDLKPSNIFLAFSTASTKPEPETKIRDIRLADFGFAEEIKTILSKVSQTEYRKSASRFYTAPEQWKGRPQSSKSDQYALAVVVYELFKGFPPFMGNDMEILRLAVLNEQPSEIPSLSQEMNTVLQKALAKEPDDRFASCSEFIAAMQAADRTPQKAIPTSNAARQSEKSTKTKNSAIPLAKSPAKYDTKKSVVQKTAQPKQESSDSSSGIAVNSAPISNQSPILLNLSGIRFEKSRILTGADWEMIFESSAPLHLNLSDTDLTDMDMKQLAGLDLRELRIGNCNKITDAGLACLKNMTQLTLLDLQRCRQISDSGLAHLKNLIHLETLHLRECDRITDLGVACFKNCVKLRFIDLYGCERLTDNAMTSLKGLTKLQRIDLAWCRKITGFGLSHLKKLSDLKEISLAGCRLIREEDLDSFHHALPNCRITG